MVSIDYRLHYGVEEQEVIELFKSIGYVYIRKKKKALKKGDKRFSAEEFIKLYENGRFHIFIEFSSKSSGTEAYPQVDVHAHYDYFRKKGEKDIHVTRRNIKRDMNEMYEIHKALKEHEYGYMEYKSHNSAHDTIKNTNMKFLLAELNQKYQYDKDGKYKKKLPDGQITLQIIEQRRYSHIVCVYAIGEKHDLYRDEAKEELKVLMEKVYKKINDNKQIYDELKIGLKEDILNLKELEKLRDSKNARTQELISLLKDVEKEIRECLIAKKKKILGYRKKKIETQLIKNKKIADENHENYIILRKKVNKLKKKAKKFKV